MKTVALALTYFVVATFIFYHFQLQGLLLYSAGYFTGVLYTLILKRN